MSIAGVLIIAATTLAFAAAALVLYVLRFMVGLFLDNPVVTLEALPAVAPRAPAGVVSTPLAPRARDGVPLSAFVRSVRASPRGLVVFVPEFANTQEVWPKYAGALVEAGFAVLTFDFRSTGASPSIEDYVPRKWCTRHEVDDLLGVLDAAVAHIPEGGHGLVLLGVSRGGVASLAATAQCPQVSGVIVEGVASTLSVIEGYTRRWARIWAPDAFVDAIPEALIRGAARIVLSWGERRARVTFPLVSGVGPPAAGDGARVLFIYGAKDRHVDARVQARTYAAYAGPKELWTVPGARHNAAVLASPDEYRRRVLAFVEESLGLASETTSRATADAVGTPANGSAD